MPAVAVFSPKVSFTSAEPVGLYLHYATNACCLTSSRHRRAPPRVAMTNVLYLEWSARAGAFLSHAPVSTLLFRGLSRNEACPICPFSRCFLFAFTPFACHKMVSSPDQRPPMAGTPSSRPIRVHPCNSKSRHKRQHPPLPPGVHTCRLCAGSPPPRLSRAHSGTSGNIPFPRRKCDNKMPGPGSRNECASHP